MSVDATAPEWDEYDMNQECNYCLGAGEFHDCGDDTCCCLYPDRDDMWICPECHGKGEL